MATAAQDPRRIFALALCSCSSAWTRFSCLAGNLLESLVRKCAHLSRVFVTQCGICGASAQDRRLAIFDLRFKLSLHGADSGACSPASSSSALASSRVCLGRSRGLAAGAQAARAARYMGRKTCWGSETGYYYLRHATHRLALPQSAHRVAVALSACIAVVSSR